MSDLVREAGPLSLYLHIPFCTVRCAYCDFNTYASLEGLMAPYTAALCREIRLVGEAGGRPLAHTLYFGGGTPSLLPLELHARIFAALREAFTLTSDCEITLEANPGTLSRAYLEGLRTLGVNRLSLGAQSSHPHELRLLDRLHLFGDVVQAVSWAQAAGFENINLDLIYALPHQTLAQWQATLHRVLALGPEHISAYALSLEHGTPLRAWVYRGLLPMPDPDLAAEMYEWASETLERHGYVQYEISNWARDDGERMTAARSDPKSEIENPKSKIENPKSKTPNPKFACRHNLQYWRNEEYLGFGAGAHGHAAGLRYSNVLAPAAYIQRIESGERRPYPLSPAVSECTRLTPEETMGETMMMGMRLVREGVSNAEFERRFGVSLAARYPRELRALQRRGLIEWDGRHARLTRAGRLLGNQVFREFLAG
jgi:oxygen-independent coproporphyrinogen-3 oxidase